MVHGSAQTENRRGRLHEDTHLVVVVGAFDRDAVHAGADNRAKYFSRQGDVTVAVLCVRQLGHRGIMSQSEPIAEAVWIEPVTASHAHTGE